MLPYVRATTPVVRGDESPAANRTDIEYEMELAVEAVGSVRYPHQQVGLE